MQTITAHSAMDRPAHPSCQRESQASPPCLNEICSSLDRLGVPMDAKWRSLILYMRGIQDFDTLDDQQKSELQRMVLTVLRNRDFSDESFRQVVRRKDEIIARPWVGKLEQALAEAASLVSEFEASARRRMGDLQGLEQATVSIVQSGDPLERVVARIREGFAATLALLEEDNRRLLALSAMDQLTGLPNRRTFDSFLALAMAECARDGAPMALALLDIDHFKKFNDTYGHQVGDQALRSVASVLASFRAALAEGAPREVLAARYGGEEFALVMPGLNVSQSLDAAEELRRRMAAYNFVVRDENGRIQESDVRITISVGLAEAMESCPGAGPEALLRCADRALYRAKAEGRNRVRDYQPD